jgi:hypothetical protein
MILKNLYSIITGENKNYQLFQNDKTNKMKRLLKRKKVVVKSLKKKKLKNILKKKNI